MSQFSSDHAGMPVSQGAGVTESTIKALAVAPQGITTTQQAAVGESHAASVVPAVTERAIGTAQVDTSFLSQMQPNVGGLQQAMELVALKESEKASQEAAAQAALMQAGLLMAQAAQVRVLTLLYLP